MREQRKIFILDCCGKIWAIKAEILWRWQWIGFNIIPEVMQKSMRKWQKTNELWLWGDDGRPPRQQLESVTIIFWDPPQSWLGSIRVGLKILFKTLPDGFIVSQWILRVQSSQRWHCWQTAWTYAMRLTNLSLWHSLCDNSKDFHLSTSPSPRTFDFVQPSQLINMDTAQHSTQHTCVYLFICLKLYLFISWNFCARIRGENGQLSLREIISKVLFALSVCCCFSHPSSLSWQLEWKWMWLLQ